MRRLLLLLAACADGADSIPGADDRPDAPSFVAVTFNAGTPRPHADEGFGPEQVALADRWYGNGLAWRPAIQAAAASLRALAPDVVALQEVFDVAACAEVPADAREGFACEDHAPGGPSVPEQLLGDAFQIACHPGKPDKCLAVRRSLGALRGCDGDDCADALVGAPVEGCGGGARVARGRIDLHDGTTLAVVSVHGTSGMTPSDHACRLAQVEQVFVDLGDGAPGASEAVALVLGDFNTDPVRFAEVDPAAARLLDFAGEGRPFAFLHPLDGPPTYRGVATIDLALGRGLRGSCEALGVTPGTAPVAGGAYFDHAPLVCDLAVD